MAGQRVTTIGSSTAVDLTAFDRPTNLGSIVPVQTGSISLTQNQVAEAEQMLAGLDFATLPAGRVVQLGFEAEQALQKTLDGFLTRLDKKTASKVFALFDRLEQGVKEANLPEVLEKIQAGDKPSFLAKLGGRFRGKKAEEVAREMYNEVRDLIAGRTKNLSAEMLKLEKDLHTEMQMLLSELEALDQLKQSYRDHFSNFAVSAAVAQAFLQKAKAYVAEEAIRVSQAPDAQAQAQLQELQNKLQMLESRALALEGTYTRLPADQMVIQQIEQAGVATLQETATTAAARFASIKMTLLALHGAFAVKGVQQLASKQAALDHQLTTVRGTLMKDVVQTAATAPGDNRLAQAQQIEKIIAETREIRVLVEASRQVNEEKFDQAREKFRAARAQLSTL